MEKGYSALIYGATGAVGRQLVQQLLNSPKWKTVHVVVRRQLEEWAQHPNKAKLQIQVLKDMDQILKPQQFKYKGFDSIFSCLGSQIKHGQQTFVKIDKKYPLSAADIALRNNIPHFLLVSTIRANADSWFFYQRTKGETQNELKAKKLPLLTIMRPGLLLNRHDERFVEKIGSFLPFFDKIQTKQVAMALRKTAQRDIQKAKTSTSQIQMYDNDQMIQMLKI